MNSDSRPLSHAKVAESGQVQSNKPQLRPCSTIPVIGPRHLESASRDRHSTDPMPISRAMSMVPKAKAILARLGKIRGPGKHSGHVDSNARAVDQALLWWPPSWSLLSRASSHPNGKQQGPRQHHGNATITVAHSPGNEAHGNGADHDDGIERPFVDIPQVIHEVWCNGQIHAKSQCDRQEDDSSWPSLWVNQRSFEGVEISRPNRRARRAASPPTAR